METNEMKIARDKYWSECNEIEKSERLRTQIKRLQSEVSMLNRIARLMQAHSHLPDGSVVVPLFMKDEPVMTEYNPKIGHGDDVFF